MPKLSLTTRILIAMLAGLLIGSGIHLLGNDGWIQQYLIDGLFLVLGKWFIAALKMMVVPLVLVSLVNGVASLSNTASLGKMSIQAISLYLATTAIAVSIALSLAIAIGPGQGYSGSVEQADYVGKSAPPLTDVLINIVPSNPVQAMADGQMLQIIVFAILLGLAITLVGERAKPVRELFQSLDHVVMKMVEMLIALAPYGVFALITRTFATQGWELFGSLIGYFLTLSLALAIQALLVYPNLLRLLAGCNPFIFLKKIREPASFAFSTASSGATIPITLRTVRDKLGVKESISSFSVPLGATINMDGTAMMQGVATVFIANVYGIDLSFQQYLMVVITATLASVGTAAVPGVGLIMLTLVLNQVGLPVEGIALIIGIDRILDMMRTAVNVTGDCAVSCIIGRWQGQLDQATFQDPQAGSLETQEGPTPNSRQA